MKTNLCTCGKHQLRETSSGTVCSGCLNYPDRCLCNPADLGRVLSMVGVIGPIQQTRDFRDTPIGEAFEQTRHDLGLIQQSVEGKDFTYALRGLDTVIEDLEELRDNMRPAFQRAVERGIGV